MPVDDIKKNRPRPPQIPTDQIPGHNPPPNLSTAQPIQQRTPRRFDAGAIVRGDPQVVAQPQAQAFVPAPIITYQWVSRFFTSDTIKDDDGQLEVGYWLTDLEQTHDRVIGVQAVYVPGGALVLAKIQETSGVNG